LGTHYKGISSDLEDQRRPFGGGKFKLNLSVLDGRKNESYGSECG
jgi:hypothetical protein